MMRRDVTISKRGAVATGAAATGTSATGSASFGAMGIGALALGAIAVGAVAIGRLSVGRARLRRVEIGELVVGRLDVGASGVPGKLTAVARLRATAGSGDALEDFLAEQLAGLEDGDAPFQAQRSLRDADLFVIHNPDGEGGADGLASRFDALLEAAVEQGLAEPSAAGVELYRTI